MSPFSLPDGVLVVLFRSWFSPCLGSFRRKVDTVAQNRTEEKKKKESTFTHIANNNNNIRRNHTADGVQQAGEQKQEHKGRRLKLLRACLNKYRVLLVKLVNIKRNEKETVEVKTSKCKKAEKKKEKRNNETKSVY